MTDEPSAEQEAEFQRNKATTIRELRDLLAMSQVSASMQTQTRRGWVPAIPEPFYIGFRLRRCRCDCGLTFRNKQRYREHYAYQHIWAGDPFPESGEETIPQPSKGHQNAT